MSQRKATGLWFTPLMHDRAAAFWLPAVSGKDHQFVVVHNGIITNFRPLKNFLVSWVEDEALVLSRVVCAAMAIMAGFRDLMHMKHLLSCSTCSRKDDTQPLLPSSPSTCPHRSATASAL